MCKEGRGERREEGGGGDSVHLDESGKQGGNFNEACLGGASQCG